LKKYFFILLSVFLLGCEGKKPLVYEGWSMTMPYKIVIADKLSSSQMQNVLSILSFTLDEINQTYNNWNSESEVSQFNKQISSYPISKKLQKLIKITTNAYELSCGRFDPTVGPVSMAFHKAYLEDKPMQIKNSLSIGWEYVHLNGNVLLKDKEDISLDFCGIAKGYCLDLIIERLSDIGIKNALVEWSGEIRVIGKKEDTPWSVQIDSNLPPISLKDAAIATSGSQYNQINSKDAICHVIDPKTKKPMPVISSIKKVSVKAPTCAIADALATAAMTFDNMEEAKTWAKEITEKQPNITFWFF
jgi:thiamine biosynthesis lipoprotein